MTVSSSSSSIPSLKDLILSKYSFLQPFISPEEPDFSEINIPQELIKELTHQVQKATIKEYSFQLFSPRSGCFSDDEQLYLMKLYILLTLKITIDSILDSSDIEKLSKCLAMAIERHNLKTALYLVENGANLHVSIDFENKGQELIYAVPFKHAIDTHFDSFLFEILKKESPENYKNYDYPYLIIMANNTENPELLDFLLSNKISLESLSFYGKTPLSTVLAMGSDRDYEKNKKLIPLLIDAGANLKTQDGEGKTPLMVALEWNRSHEVITS